MGSPACSLCLRMNSSGQVPSWLSSGLTPCEALSMSALHRVSMRRIACYCLPSNTCCSNREVWMKCAHCSRELGILPTRWVQAVYFLVYIIVTRASLPRNRVASWFDTHLANSMQKAYFGLLRILPPPCRQAPYATSLDMRHEDPSPRPAETACSAPLYASRLNVSAGRFAISSLVARAKILAQSLAAVLIFSVAIK